MKLAVFDGTIGNYVAAADDEGCEQRLTTLHAVAPTILQILNVVSKNLHSHERH